MGRIIGGVPKKDEELNGLIFQNDYTKDDIDASKTNTTSGAPHLASGEKTNNVNTNTTPTTTPYTPTVTTPSNTNTNTEKDSDTDYNRYVSPEFVLSDSAKLAAQNKANAEAALKALGGFTYGNMNQLDAIMQSILNRDKFTFDLNGNALYNQYKDKYIQQGKMAMMDTMGQAAAMTGGYGNSYAQSVGQQAYQAQLQNLNDIIPELYQMALDKYNSEGQELYNQYSLLTDDYNREYGEYLDKYNQAIAERDYATNDYYNQYAKDWSEYTYNNDIELNEHGNEYNANNNKNSISASAKAELLKELGYTDEQIASGELEPEPTIADNIKAELEGMDFADESQAAAWLSDKYGDLDVPGIGEILSSVLDEMGYAPPLSERKWTLVDDGGTNLLGINRNARVKDGYGNEYTLNELRKELMKTMSRAEANEIIYSIQEELGIQGAKWE